MLKATDADYMIAHFKDSMRSLGIKNGYSDVRGVSFG